MNARPNLALVESGQVPEDAPQTYSEALTLLGQLDTSVRMLERDLNAKRLRIAALETDREQAALDNPQRAEVDLLHAVWLAAFPRKRRPLDFNDREQMSRAVKKFGLAFCFKALAGAKHDSKGRPRKNGTPRNWDDLDDIFKSFHWVEEYAKRAPLSWQIKPEAIAALGGVEVKWVEARL